MIAQFDKTTCNLLSREVEAALAEIAARHGLVAVRAGGSFSPGEFTAKVKFTLARSNPAAVDVERADFAKWCGFYGLKPEHYGARLDAGKFGTLTLIGFAPNRSKHPIKVRDASGTVRVFSESIVRLAKEHGGQASP